MKNKKIFLGICSIFFVTSVAGLIIFATMWRRNSDAVEDHVENMSVSNNHTAVDQNPINTQNGKRLKAFIGQLANSISDTGDPESSPQLELDELPSDKLAHLTKNAIRDTVVTSQFYSLGPAVMDEMVQTQESDIEWNDNTRQDLIDRFALVGEDAANLKDVQCGQTICKIVTEHADEKASDKLYRLETESSAIEGDAFRFSKKTPDGRIETAVYVGRYGASERFHDMVKNRVYNVITGKSVDTIMPTEKELKRIDEMYRNLNTGDPDSPQTDALSAPENFS